MVFFIICLYDNDFENCHQHRFDLLGKSSWISGLKKLLGLAIWHINCFLCWHCASPLVEIFDGNIIEMDWPKISYSQEAFFYDDHPSLGDPE